MDDTIQVEKTAIIEKIDIEKVDWRGSREFFESLGDALDRLDDKDESYDFTWVGKRKAIIEAGAPINKTFRPDVEASKNWDTTENLFIEGDNLDALKLLQESYLGKVKMIYIDPPYNRGADSVYHDDFELSVEQYDENTEYKDKEGNIQFKKNERSNGRFHSDWLSMMYPRLKLARNLLTDDGLMFISIDDNESANLKKICDEVFGEDNFVNCITIKTSESSGVKMNHIEKKLPKIKEYLYVYSKNINTIKLTPLKISKITNLEDFKSYSKYYSKIILNPQDNPEKWNIVGLKEYAEEHEIDISTDAKLVKFQLDNADRVVYRTNNASLAELQFNTQIAKVLSPTGLEYIWWEGKQMLFLSDYIDESLCDLWTDISTINLNKELPVGMPSYTDGQKPIALIDRLLQLMPGDSFIALDFFSGSGTTAHATLLHNALNKTNISFVLVQYPENLDENLKTASGNAKKGVQKIIDFLDSIDKLHFIPEYSRERIRRAGDKIAAENPDAKVDYGFRALRIEDTNHKDVYISASEHQQSILDSLVDNVKEDRNDLDLLFGVLTQTALELNRPLETVELDGSTCYKYDYFGESSGLVACFATNISEDTIKQIAGLKPLTAVFRESSFPNSQAKVNLAEHFRVLSPNTKLKVV